MVQIGSPASARVVRRRSLHRSHHSDRSGGIRLWLRPCRFAVIAARSSAAWISSCRQAPLHRLDAAGIAAGGDDAELAARLLKRVLVDVGLGGRLGVILLNAQMSGFGDGNLVLDQSTTGFGPQPVIPPTRPRDGSVVSSLYCMNDPQPEGHMASHFGRRKFLATLGGAASWPLAARAQQAERVRRVGVLMPMGADSPVGQARLAAFLQGLQQFGWAVGRNLRIDLRWAAGEVDALASTRRNWWRSRPTSS